MKYKDMSIEQKLKVKWFLIGMFIGVSIMNIVILIEG